jgi:hypothetical protein
MDAAERAVFGAKSSLKVKFGERRLLNMEEPR